MSLLRYFRRQSRDDRAREHEESIRAQEAASVVKHQAQATMDTACARLIAATGVFTSEDVARLLYAHADDDEPMNGHGK